MRRHPKLIPLSRQHRKMLMLAQLLKKGAPPYKGLPRSPEGKIEYAIGLYIQLIEKHFAIEEAFVFPLLGGTPTLDPLIAELKEEHQHLRAYFQQLDPAKPNLELMDSLGHLLEKHIRKEERQYFQAVQSEKEEELLTLELPLGEV